MAAVIAACRLVLHLPESQSLKDKRQVLRSLQSRLTDAYSVSVAETGSQDKWQSAELLVAYASSDSRHADEVLAKVIAFVESYHLPVELLDAETELIHAF
ncbi:protein of unknown function DUF503 [Thermobaculum terrenum ATCC BAA-798]|uniref:DUF503 domain-containing protein n=1 Tax=Thermobaculum terrenum (strain ATCC BAA-798 / CCMEE 7001 / YNP1) TaxID=525904 RepID=D1CCY4_THET1|nr:DUF503 domain-containing protein [Thermobaculum terrenum]ACZ42649.1 protein of unknown function DUF503 [Thermobaculum terrenum ATCC BAA-798]